MTGGVIRETGAPTVGAPTPAGLTPAADSYEIRLAKRITESINTYEKLAADCWRVLDVTAAVRYRGMAEGLAMAREHQLAVAEEMRAEGGAA